MPYRWPRFDKRKRVRMRVLGHRETCMRMLGLKRSQELQDVLDTGIRILSSRISTHTIRWIMFMNGNIRVRMTKINLRMWVDFRMGMPEVDRSMRMTNCSRFQGIVRVT